MFKEIKKCRICNSCNLKEIINLGNLYLTGIFPKPGESIDKSPLILIRCNTCGLLQLKHTYNLEIMYGNTYGYHSSLNISMIEHLKEIVHYIENKVDINKGDFILDIGSNDGTTLKQYSISGVEKFGVDPTISKFKYYYPEDIYKIPDFFPSVALRGMVEDKKFKVITSIACFYDLENPLLFAKEIYNLLDNDGIWLIEQSYAPKMISELAFDTICHEHLEYYSLTDIKHIADMSGLKIIDVSFNNINGGSFMVVLTKQENSTLFINQEFIDIVLSCEKEWNNETTFVNFKNNIINYKNELKNFLNNIKKLGCNIYGYGASTKGNVLLQYCDIDNSIINGIVEVNKDKFGCVTPGSNISIIDEKSINKNDIDYFFVLPWHFKENILKRFDDNRKFKFIFPLPNEVKVI